jgi:nitronate monooxygenase
MPLERTFNLKSIQQRYPIFQGGMGVGISLYGLASAVGGTGCIGTVSSAALDQLTAKRLGKPRMGLIEATATEIADTIDACGVAAINVMVALFNSYEDSIRGAIEGGVDMIVSGAGLPLSLPSIVKRVTGSNDHGISLIPIISSSRAFELICKKWDRQGYRPDAVVLEGPKAGGHLGWNYKQVGAGGADFLKRFDLFDELLDPVLDMSVKYKNGSGPIPVIVAGGIYTHRDVTMALKRGAVAVQLGTRFAATVESDGSADFKRALVAADSDDIMLGTENWGSPCGLPFRYLAASPLAIQKNRMDGPFCICTCLLGGAGIDSTDKLGQKGYPRGCPEKYVLPPGENPICSATGKNTSYKPLYTCGTEAHRVDRILPVQELVDELVGNTAARGVAPEESPNLQFADLALEAL